MKYFGILLFAFIISFPAWSQDTLAEKHEVKKMVEYDRTLKPEEGDMAVSFDATGITDNIKLAPFTNSDGSQTLAFKYFFKDDLAFRIGLGVNSIRNNVSSADSSRLFGNPTYVERDSTYKKTNIYISPGIEKHILTTSRIDPFFSASIVLGFLGGENINTNTLLSDTLGVDRTTTTFTQQGGISVGLNVGTGFNFFVTKKLSIGAEYSLSFIASSIGGDWQRVTSNISVNNNETNMREIGSAINSDTFVKTNGVAGLTLTYFFGIKKR